MDPQKTLLGTLSLKWVWVILAALLTCIGNLCLKQARFQGGGYLSPFFFLGILSYGINVLVFSKALDSLPLSVAYPVFAALGFVCIAGASSFLFQETLGWQQWIGMFLILVGVTCMSM